MSDAHLHCVCFDLGSACCECGQLSTERVGNGQIRREEGSTVQEGRRTKPEEPTHSEGRASSQGQREQTMIGKLSSLAWLVLIILLCFAVAKYIGWI